MRWLARVGGIVVALIGVAWMTDDLWAIPLILAAPSSDGPSPSHAPDDAETLFVSSGGEQIEAWVLSPADPRGTVLVLHGIRDRKDSMVPLGRRLVDDGFRAVLVDLRGHGASTGAHLSYGVHDRHDLTTLLDALAQRDLLQRPVGVHGTSYGAGVAVLLAAHDPRVESVVAIAPFASLREVVPAYAELMFGPVGSAMPGVWMNDVIDRAGEEGDFDPDEACPRCVAAAFDAPLFVAHGDADRRIPPWHGRRIVEARGDRPTELVIAPGANHGTIGGIVGARARAHLRATLH